MTIFLKSRPVMAAFLLTGRDQHAMTPEGCGHVVKKSDTAILVVSEAATRGDCQAQARYKSERGAAVGKLNVAVQKKLVYGIELCSVTKTTQLVYSLPDEQPFLSYLRTVFHQAVTDWAETVVKRPPLVFDEWDMNGDGCVDMTDSDLDTDDRTLIYEKYKEQYGGVKNENAVVFFVKCLRHNGGGTPPAGVSKLKSRIVFVVGDYAPPTQYYIIAHELGHGVYGLGHACAQPLAGGTCVAEPYRIDDVDNIMTPQVPEALPIPPCLRFWQWKHMRKLQ